MFILKIIVVLLILTSCNSSRYNINNTDSQWTKWTSVEYMSGTNQLELIDYRTRFNKEKNKWQIKFRNFNRKGVKFKYKLKTPIENQYFKSVLLLPGKESELQSFSFKKDCTNYPIIFEVINIRYINISPTTTIQGYPMGHFDEF